jgi:hypothetical protein
VTGLSQIGRLLSFLLFLWLGVRVARARGDSRRRAAVLFTAYTVLIHLAAGVSQIDNWPFTSHTLAVGRMRDDHPLTWLTLKGVDPEGKEWDLDPQTFSPVFDSILQYWLTSRYPALSEADRREAGRFLVARANASRARLHAGERVGFERLLGPLAAGYWWRLPRARAASDREYRSIRVYRGEYTLPEIAAFGRIRRETLLLELHG